MMSGLFRSARLATPSLAVSDLCDVQPLGMGNSRRFLVPMRLVFRYRFSMRSLLLLVLMTAVACWWVIYPDNTMRRFNSLLAAGRTDQARKMVVLPSDWAILSDGLLHITAAGLTSQEFDVIEWQSCFLSPRLQARSRGPGDVLAGRRVFQSEVIALGATFTERYYSVRMESKLLIEFAFERGKVRIMPLQKGAIMSSIE